MPAWRSYPIQLISHPDYPVSCHRVTPTPIFCPALTRVDGTVIKPARLEHCDGDIEAASCLRVNGHGVGRSGHTIYPHVWEAFSLALAGPDLLSPAGGPDHDLVHPHHGALLELAGAQPVVTVGAEHGALGGADDIVEATGRGTPLGRHEHADLELDARVVAGIARLHGATEIAIYLETQN